MQCSMPKIFAKIIKRIKERRVQIPHWSAAVTVGMLNSLFTTSRQEFAKGKIHFIIVYSAGIFCLLSKKEI